MKRAISRALWGVAGSCAWVLSACSASDAPSESVSSTEQGQTLYGVGLNVPTPKVSPAPWSASQLLFADALSICTATSPADTQVRGGGLRDASLTALKASIDATLGAQTGGRPASWRALRATAALNKGAITGGDQAVPLTGQYPALYALDDAPNLNAALAELQPVFDGAGVNLCMARLIYEQTRLEATLLTSTLDKLAMLEVARERAQIAMMTLATIHTTLAASTDGIPDDSLERSVWLLRRWGEEARVAPPGSVERLRLEQLSVDLKEAVRLEVHLATEMAQLMLRSASARLPLPGGIEKLPADDFAPGHWRERVVALLYGGDPLATRTLGATPPRATASPGALAWPSRDERPYATPGRWTGGAIRLYALARSLGALKLPLKTSSYTGSESLAEGAASHLYRRIEQAYRSSLCVGPKPEPCAVPPFADIATPGTDLSAFELYSRQNLTPADAAALTTALTEVLPRASGGGLHVAGSLSVRMDEDGTPLLVVGPGVLWSPPTLTEAASVYGRMGRVHLAETLGVASPVPAHVTSPLLSGAEPARVDGARTMGAIAALSAIGELVRAEAKTPLAATLKAALAGGGADLAAFLEGSLGPAHVSIRAPETATPTESGVALAQPLNASGEPLWTVRVIPSPGDEFWTGRPDELSFVATTSTGAALERLFDPAQDKPLTALSALVDEAQAAGRRTSVTRSSSGSFSGLLAVPAGQSAVVFAVRRPRGKPASYRLLAGPVKLWVGSTPLGAVKLPTAVDGLYLSRGGALERLAMNALVASAWDLAQPALDGFGQPIGRIPDRSTDLTKDAPVLGEYIASKLADANRTAAEAAATLTTAFQGLKDAETQALDVDLAKSRAVETERGVLVTLCGAPPVGPGQEDLPPEARVARACGLSQVQADVLGVKPLAENVCPGGTPGTPLPSLTSPTACDPNGALGPRLRCAVDALVGNLNFTAELLTPVACAGTSGVPTLPPALEGRLAVLALGQATARANYRASAEALVLSADALLSRLAASQAAVEVAESERVAAERRLRSAERVADEALVRATKELELAKTAERGAIDYANKMGISNDKETAEAAFGTTAKVASNIVGGFVTNTTLGLLGGVAGAIAALIDVFGGPSDEDISRAQTDIEVSKQKVSLATDALTSAAQAVACKVPKPPNSPECLEGSELAYFQAEAMAREKAIAAAAAAGAVAYREAFVTLRDRLTALQLAAAELIKSRVEINNALREATLAIEQARFESALAVKREAGLFGIFQAFHGSSLQAGIGLADVASANALDAQRAFEFAYGRSLSTESVDTARAFVAPEKWVGDAFTPDLRPLRFVGRQELATAPGAMADRNTKHLVNLSSVVNGGLFEALGVQAGRNGALIIDIPGPAGEVVVGEQKERAAFARQWQFYCPKTSTCAPDGGWCNALRTDDDPAKACVTEAGAALLPERARVNLQLDAAGGLRNNPTPQGTGVDAHFNARWIRFMGNVSSGLPGPQNQSLSFSLEAKGPFVVTSPGGERVLAIDPASTGRVLAKMTGKRVEPNGSEMRTEPDRAITTLFGYPVAGSYELVLYARGVTDPTTGRPPRDLTKLKEFQIAFDRAFLARK